MLIQADELHSQSYFLLEVDKTFHPAHETCVPLSPGQHLSSLREIEIP